MSFNPTKAQTEAIQIPIGGTIAVSAPAGTGKTSVLSEVVAGKMVAEKGRSIRNLLVITFTRKAAAEMAERIENRLRELAEEDQYKPERDRLIRASGKVADAAIETIDAFSARMLREHAAVAGLDPNFDILDQDETLLLGERVAGECLERWLHAPPHEKWPKVVEETNVRDWPKLLNDLDAHLMTRRAVVRDRLLIPEEAVTIRGGIDSVRRELLESIEDYEEQLRQVAEEGKEKRSNYGKQAEALIPDIPRLRDWLEQDSLDWDSPIVRKVSVWDLWSRNAKAPFRTDVVNIAHNIKKHLLGDVKSEDKETETLLGLDLDYLLRDHREALATAILDFHNSFLNARRSENALSFADCEIEALELLEQNPHIQDSYRERFEFVVVDEFQDINPLQKDLIYALSRPSDDENFPANLYVVGDVRQSIYGFRDADHTQIVNLRKALDKDKNPDFGNRILYDSFRSRPELLNVVNFIFKSIWSDVDFHTDLRPAFEDYLRVGASDKPVGPRCEMHIVQASDSSTGRRNEATVIARRLAELVRDESPLIWARGPDGSFERSIEWQDCALLFRTRKVFALYEQAFATLGIPCRTESGGGFWDQREIGDIIALLSCLSPMNDDIDWAVLLRSPWVGLSDDALLEVSNHAIGGKWSDALGDIRLPPGSDQTRLTTFLKWLKHLQTLAGRVPVARILEGALERSGYAQRVFAQNNGRLVRANIEHLLGSLNSDRTKFDIFAAANHLRWLRDIEAGRAQATVDSESKEGAVTLATVHAAKGLEWPLVVLPDLARKPKTTSDEVSWSESTGLTFGRINPATGETEKPASSHIASRAKLDAERDEDKRVLYVALTRAREWLILSSWAKDVSTKWSVDKYSWLSQLDKALTLGNQNLLGNPDNEPDEILEFKDDNGFKIRRVTHSKVQPLKSDGSARIPDPAEVDELHKALDSMKDLPPATAERYMVTASELAAFDKCPRMYEYRSVIGIPSRWEFPKPDAGVTLSGESDFETEGEFETPEDETFELPASEWGTLCHTMLETVSLEAGADEIRDEAVRLLKKAGIEPDSPLTEALAEGRPPGETFILRLTDMAASTLKLPLFEKLRACKDVQREFRLLGNLGKSEKVVLGILDLCASCDGRPVIVDFKSGKVEKSQARARAGDYELQLSIYAHLVAAREGVDPSQVEAHIIFLDPSEDVEIDLTTETLNHALEVIEALSKASLDNDFPTIPLDDICSRCDFQDICPKS